MEAGALPWWLKVCRGHRMEARESPQWSPNGRYRSAKGGTVVVQGRQKRRLNWCIVFTTVCIFTGRQMADHCASILRPRRCVWLPPASFGWSVSDRHPQRLLCDCLEHAQNFTATMASMAIYGRPVYRPWTIKAIVRPPFCLQRRPDQFCGRTREHKGGSPCVKVVLITQSIVQSEFRKRMNLPRCHMRFIGD